MDISSPYIKKALCPFGGFHSLTSVLFFFSILRSSIISGADRYEFSRIGSKKGKGSTWKPQNGLKAFLIQCDDMFICVHSHT